MRGRKADFKQTITRRMAEAPAASVWTPSDFLDVAPRQAVDQTLTRLIAANVIQRVARGLYRIPQVNVLTGEYIAPDVAAVMAAIAREKKIHISIDEKHPNASVDRVIAITTARISPLTIGTTTIEFRQGGRKQRQARVPTPRRAAVRLTGNTGSGYEDFVAARFLLDLLSGTNTLGLTFGRVTRLDWQARDAGWLADDLAVTCESQDGQTRAAGISIKSNQQVTNSGFPPDFVALAWRQWLGRDTKRVFRQGTDAIVLATAKLPAHLKRDWEALLTEALQTTPERMVARLAPDDGEGAQSSALQRAMLKSFGPPDSLAEGSRPEHVVSLLHDVRLPGYSKFGQWERSGGALEALDRNRVRKAPSWWLSRSARIARRVTERIRPPRSPGFSGRLDGPEPTYPRGIGKYKGLHGGFGPATEDGRARSDAKPLGGRGHLPPRWRIGKWEVRAGQANRGGRLSARRVAHAKQPRP